jgi:GAF domain-containing protein
VGPLTDSPLGPQSLTYQEQQRLAAHMQSLYAMAQGFRGVKDEPGVVDAAARLAQDHFGAERVLLLELRDALGAPVRPQPGAPVSTAQVAARWGWEDGRDFAPFTSFVTGRAVGWENVLTAAEPLAIPDMRAALPAEFLPPLRMESWRSAVFIPLRAGDEWLGALGLGYHSGYHTFTADDLELAETLGAEAARALAGQRLQDAEHQLRRQLAALEMSHAVLARRGRDLSAINQTAQALATLADEDTLCARVVDVLAANFGYTSALIGLVSGDRLRLRAMRGFEESAPATEWPLASGVIGRVARTGRPALVTDVDQDPDYVRVRAGTHSEICVPLLGRGGVLGVVDIESSGPHPLSGEDLELLMTLAPQIVIALENARLYGEAQQQARRLALITRVAHIMTSMAAGEPASLLEEATALLQRELGYANVSVMLREPGSGVLVCCASAGDYTGFIGPGYRQAPGVGLLGWVARHAKTLVVNDVRAEPRFYQADPAEQPGAEVIVPLIHHGALVGLLDVESATPHAFAPTDVQMLETLADQLAVALAQAEQLESLRRAAGRAARRRSA